MECLPGLEGTGTHQHPNVSLKSTPVGSMCQTQILSLNAHITYVLELRDRKKLEMGDTVWLLAQLSHAPNSSAHSVSRRQHLPADSTLSTRTMTNACEPCSQTCLSPSALSAFQLTPSLVHLHTCQASAQCPHSGRSAMGLPISSYQHPNGYLLTQPPLRVLPSLCFQSKP